MRQRGIPLFTWDTRQPVGEADIFAISLQYEMGFTNVLLMLDLAGIPLHAPTATDAPSAGHRRRAAGRQPRAGGRLLRPGRHRRRRAQHGRARRAVPRDEAAGGLAARHHPRGGPAVRLGLRPVALRVRLPRRRHHRRASGPSSGVPGRASCRAAFIERCQTPDFETVAFPTRPIVPFTEIVHDRIAIEIMRGCPQRCRFCHAGYTKRPLRPAERRSHPRHRRAGLARHRPRGDRPAEPLHRRLPAASRTGRAHERAVPRPRT